jgi:hypothetical protein
MASVTYMHSMMNIYNDLRRDNLYEALNVLKNENLLTDEIRTVIITMTSTASQSIKLEKKPRSQNITSFQKNIARLLN